MQFKKHRAILSLNIMLGVIAISVASCENEISSWQEHWKQGEQLLREREFASAMLEYQSALFEAEKFGEQDSRLPQTLTRLAALYDAQGSWDKALPLLERSLAIQEKILGPDHPDLYIPLRNIGAVHQIQHQFDQAQQYFKQALWIREGNLGPDHPDMRGDLEVLVGLAVSKIQFQEANPFLTRSLDSLPAAGKEKSPHGAATQTHDDLSKLSTAQQQYEMAKPYLKQAINRDEKQWDFSDPRKIGSIQNVIQAASTPSKQEQIEAYLQRFIMMADEEQPHSRLTPDQGREYLAELYRMQGRFEEAILTLKPNLPKKEISSKSLYEQNVETLVNFAILHHSNNQYSEALHWYKIATDVGKASLEREHPLMKRAKKSREFLLKKWNDVN